MGLCVLQPRERHWEAIACVEVPVLLARIGPAATEACLAALASRGVLRRGACRAALLAWVCHWQSRCTGKGMAAGRRHAEYVLILNPKPQKLNFNALL